MTCAGVGLQGSTEAGNFVQLGIGPVAPEVNTVLAPEIAAFTPAKYRSSTSRRVMRLRGATSTLVPPEASAVLPCTLPSVSRMTVPVSPFAAATEVIIPGLVGSGADGLEMSGAANATMPFVPPPTYTLELLPPVHPIPSLSEWIVPGWEMPLDVAAPKTCT